VLRREFDAGAAARSELTLTLTLTLTHSPKVAGAGCFGASLMLEPQRVADCAAGIAAGGHTEVTVKCRIGVDAEDSYDALCRFVSVVSERSPATHFVIHARKVCVCVCVCVCVQEGASASRRKPLSSLSSLAGDGAFTLHTPPASKRMQRALPTLESLTLPFP
jgi:hypothetical protein